MSNYEYKVVPAPQKGLKAKGVKGAEARFSHALETLMNDMAADGWHYQRAETLPSIERVGLTGSTTEWRNVLVFRRPRENDAEAFQPELLSAPETPPVVAEKPEPQAPAKQPEKPAGAEPKTPSEPAGRKEPELAKPASAETSVKADNKTATDTPSAQPDAVRKADAIADNGVENTSDLASARSTLEKFANMRNASKTDG